MWPTKVTKKKINVFVDVPGSRVDNSIRQVRTRMNSGNCSQRTLSIVDSSHSRRSTHSSSSHVVRQDGSTPTESDYDREYDLDVEQYTHYRSSHEAKDPNIWNFSLSFRHKRSSTVLCHTVNTVFTWQIKTGLMPKHFVFERRYRTWNLFSRTRSSQEKTRYSSATFSSCVSKKRIQWISAKGNSRFCSLTFFLEVPVMSTV